VVGVAVAAVAMGAYPTANFANLGWGNLVVDLMDLMA